MEIKGVKLKFNKEGIEWIRDKIDSDKLKAIGRGKKTSFTRERKMRFTKWIVYNKYIMEEFISS